MRSARPNIPVADAGTLAPRADEREPRRHLCQIRTPSPRLSVVSLHRIGSAVCLEASKSKSFHARNWWDSESGGLITQAGPDCQLATTKKSHGFVFTHAPGVQVSIREGALVSKSYEQSHARGLRTHTPRKR